MPGWALRAPSAPHALRASQAEVEPSSLEKGGGRVRLGSRLEEAPGQPVSL